MQRYFVDNKLSATNIHLNNDDSHHIKNVMRMSLGDNIEVVFDNKLYLCEIIDLTNQVEVKIINELPITNELPCQVTIAQALVNEQKMDYILQKTCELGVNEIIPIKTTRSIINVSNKEDKKIKRWKKILNEAREQSKRCSIPTIKNVTDIKDLIKLNYDYKFLCAVNEMTTTIKKVLDEIKIGDKILFVIGPEGGLTKEEEKLLIDNGFVSITFGNRVLRTETAGLYVMSIMNYILME